MIESMSNDQFPRVECDAADVVITAGPDHEPLVLTDDTARALHYALYSALNPPIGCPLCGQKWCDNSPTPEPGCVAVWQWGDSKSTNIKRIGDRPTPRTECCRGGVSP